MYITSYRESVSRLFSLIWFMFSFAFAGLVRSDFQHFSWLEAIVFFALGGLTIGVICLAAQILMGIFTFFIAEPITEIIRS